MQTECRHPPGVRLHTGSPRALRLWPYQHNTPADLEGRSPVHMDLTLPQMDAPEADLVNATAPGPVLQAAQRRTNSVRLGR